MIMEVVRLNFVEFDRLGFIEVLLSQSCTNWNCNLLLFLFVLSLFIVCFQVPILHFNFDISTSEPGLCTIFYMSFIYR